MRQSREFRILSQMGPRSFTIISALTTIFALITFALVTPAATAGPPGMEGIWTGTLEAGCSRLRLVLHVTADSAGKLRVSLDSVDQGAIGLRGESVAFEGNVFSFDIPSVSGHYQATVSSNTLGGIWSQGTPLPLVFTRTTVAAAPTPVPTPIAGRPVALQDLKRVLDQELKPVLEHGVLSKPSDGGLVVGVVDHGERRIFSYGIARSDSIFEIGSITKTFTGLILAQMVVQKQVTLNEPVRGLLPAGFAGKPSAHEITLLDLATQHSGLSRMPDNFKPRSRFNPYADYDAPQLDQFLTKHGLVKPVQTKFLYSNLGFALLGFALTEREGASYAQLVQTEITSPLNMHDTVVRLSSAQQKRLIQGYDDLFNLADPWDFGVFAGAGALKSTASDLLTYLDANLHPEKYAVGAAPGSPAANLPAAIALDHQPRADTPGGGKIALAWLDDRGAHYLWHNGGTGGYSSFAAFTPEKDWAVIALYNRSDSNRFVDCVGENVLALLLGLPTKSLDFISHEEQMALQHPARLK
jgi:serine-type D-Ala-D-Ala carboxypeptidase/endopeptidase